MRFELAPGLHSWNGFPRGEVHDCPPGDEGLVTAAAAAGKVRIVEGDPVEGVVESAEDSLAKQAEREADAAPEAWAIHFCWQAEDVARVFAVNTELDGEVHAGRQRMAHAAISSLRAKVASLEVDAELMDELMKRFDVAAEAVGEVAE